jgi:hypothetical protein|tara:strand:- start:112 stop:291 length:180 start_codon:yes stop_codon:yes gene_type:complete
MENNMNRERYKKYRLWLINQTYKKESKLTNKQKWKSIYKFTRKLEKINFNKNGEVRVAQ